MPYRRLPKTDAARLKALKTVLDNGDLYTVREHFISWKVLNSAQSLYNQLLTAVEQYKVAYASQVRHSDKNNGLKARASMYLSHFIQVLYMGVERGEIKPALLELYGLNADSKAVPEVKSTEGIMQWAPKIINGEKARLAKGGRPIYNPTIGMVSTHFDIFKEAAEARSTDMQRTRRATEQVAHIRPEVDELLLELWNAIEAHYASLPLGERLEKCKELGVIYYYRKGEKAAEE